MRPWFVYLIWSCIDEWTLTRIVCVWFCTHVLYVYMQLLCMYGLGYSLNSRSNMPCEVMVYDLGHQGDSGML